MVQHGAARARAFHLGASGSMGLWTWTLPDDITCSLFLFCPSYADQVHQGLLYVWPDASEGAAAAAASSPLPIIPELDQTDEWEPRTDWFMRDVPISMETVVENVSSRGQHSCTLSNHRITIVPETDQCAGELVMYASKSDLERQAQLLQTSLYLAVLLWWLVNSVDTHGSKSVFAAFNLPA